MQCRLSDKFMARFFFHLDHAQDGEGRELETIADAKCEAVRYACNFVCAAADRFWDTGEFNLRATDDKGLVLFTLVLSGTEAPAIAATSLRSPPLREHSTPQRG